MPAILTQTFKTPCGELLLGSYDNKLCLCDWKYRKMRSSIDKRIQSGVSAYYTDGNSEVLEQTKQQLTEYFSQQRKDFDLPLQLIGSEFQQSVWQGLLNILYGDTRSYSELAKRINKTAAVRAVGAANGSNAISIIVPCHRIVGSNGELTGYAGGLNTKKKLLALESDLFSQ